MKTYFTLLFIYFITVNKYRFCILVIGYINVQIIGIVLVIKNLYRSITNFKPLKLKQYACAVSFCVRGEEHTFSFSPTEQLQKQTYMHQNPRLCKYPHKHSDFSLKKE